MLILANNTAKVITVAYTLSAIVLVLITTSSNDLIIVRPLVVPYGSIELFLFWISTPFFFFGASSAYTWILSIGIIKQDEYSRVYKIVINFSWVSLLSTSIRLNPTTAPNTTISLTVPRRISSIVMCIDLVFNWNSTFARIYQWMNFYMALC